MSDEMLEISGTKVDTLVVGHASLETRVGDMDTRLTGVETRLTGVETRLTGVETRLTGVETRLSGVETRLTGVETQLTTVVDGQARLETQVAGLIEGQSRLEQRADKFELAQDDMRDNIKQIAEGHAAIQAHFDRRFDELQETLDRRLTPLEAAIRNRR